MVLGLELLNTHGTEIAPGSDVVGEDPHRYLRHHAASCPLPRSQLTVTGRALARLPWLTGKGRKFRTGGAVERCKNATKPVPIVIVAYSSDPVRACCNSGATGRKQHGQTAKDPEAMR
jgi:hypothetical protein